jgi:hypothetical protein
MKTRTLSLLEGAGAVLILGGQAGAGFTGVEVVSKPNPFGLLVCNVFALFDRPGQDLFLSVAGTPAFLVNIQVIGGTFYQHPMGGDKAPSAVLVDSFPSLAFDTFVTIGVKSVGSGGQPEDQLLLEPTWPGFGPSSLFTDPGWAVPASAPQADPFNPNFYAGDGHVLVGQYSTADGIGIVGEFRILVRSNNVATQVNVSFSHFIPSPGALPLLWTACLIGARRPRSRAAVIPRRASARDARRH